MLDPEDCYFSHRFYRHHCCILGNKFYTKDLRVVKRKLSSLVLVDNSAYSFLLQQANGVPILPYYDDKRDRELEHLEGYLRGLASAKDVRQVNR